MQDFLNEKILKQFINVIFYSILSASGSDTKFFGLGWVQISSHQAWALKKRSQTHTLIHTFMKQDVGER